MTEHANDVIADDNAGTRQAIELIKQHKARCVTTAAWAHMGQHGMSTFPKSGSFGEWPGDQPCDIVAALQERTPVDPPDPASPTATGAQKHDPVIGTAQRIRSIVLSDSLNPVVAQREQERRSEETQ